MNQFLGRDGRCAGLACLELERDVVAGPVDGHQDSRRILFPEMLQVLGDLLDPGVEPASQRQGPGDIFVGGVAQLRFACRPCRTQGGQQPVIDGRYSPPVDGRAADQFSANGAEGVKHFGSLFPLEAHFQRKGSLSAFPAAPIPPGEAGLLPG